MNISDPEKFLKLPGSQAEVKFNELPVSDQASLVLMTPWEKRQEIILLSHSARRIVQSLPVEELFWTIKAIGPEDALHLLQLSSAEQLQFMFDLDWWHKSDLRTEKIAAWMLLLLEAEPEVLVRWLDWVTSRDQFLLQAMLRPFLGVVKRPDEMDIHEARDLLPPFTMDDIYFFSFKREKLQPLFERFLKVLFEVAPGAYRDTMEAILYETGAESLEGAFRLKRSRLGDWGLPDYYDALELFVPLADNRIRKVDTPAGTTASSSVDLMPAFVPTLYIGECSLLRRAIERLAGKPSLERIVHEWVGVANKVLIVESVDLDDPEALKNAIDNVACLLNLGLDIAGKMERKEPDELLETAFLEDLARLALTETRRLAARVRRLMRAGLVHPDFAHLPEGWAEFLRGLLMARAVFWNTDKQEYVPFSTSAQVAGAERKVSLVSDWSRLMSNLAPHWKDWGREIPWAFTNLGHYRQLNWHQALMTALANVFFDRGLVIQPFPEADLPALRRCWFFAENRVLGGETGARASSAQAFDVLRRSASALKDVAIRAGINSTRLEELLAAPFAELSKEWEGVAEDAPIDGRFVSGLLVGLD